MKKQLHFTAILFICSWQLLSQNKAIIINDSTTIAKIEGDWYGVSLSIPCHGFCWYSINKDISSSKLNIVLIDSLMTVDLQTQLKYNNTYLRPGIELYKTYDKYSARGEKLFSYRFNENYTFLYQSGFEAGRVSYYRNPKYYILSLLTANNWNNNGCYMISNQTKKCKNDINKIDAFSTNNDTLIYFNHSRPVIKFIFDEKKYIFKLLRTVVTAVRFI